MVLKSKVIETIRQLPDQFSIDELVEKLVVLERIELGLHQVDNKEYLSEKDVKERLAKWLR